MDLKRLDIWITIISVGLVVWFLGIAPLLERYGVFAAIKELVLSIFYRFAYVDYGKLTNTPAEVKSISPEGKAEKAPAEKTEITPPAPAVDVNALRRDAQATALGVLLAHGLIKDGKRTEATKAVFGGVSGEAYSKVAAAVREAEENELAKIMIAKVTEESGERLLSIRAGKADERTIPM